VSAQRSRLRLAATAASLVVALVACVRVPPAITPRGPIVLALITWNMNAGRGDLARLIDDLSSGRLTDGSTSHFVLTLQEATRSSALDTLAVANARKLAVFFEPVYSNPSRTSGNALVSTLPLGDTRAIALPRERQPRAAVAATLEIAGERLFVVSAHLENRISWLRFGLFADRARGRQAEALVAALPTGHGVAGGDMNTTLGPNEPAWKILLTRFPDTPPDAEPTFRDRLVLDHLFFDLPDGWLATRTVLSDRYGSDHHPVLGLIRRSDVGDQRPEIRGEGSATGP
jgi:endonuclease/exonuclease/phosphatase family metal-dependent hydrolase